MPEEIFFAFDYSPYLINHQTDLLTTTELKIFEIPCDFLGFSEKKCFTRF